MWLKSVEKDELDRLVREGECCQLATGLDGEVYWASDAMCEWSGYLLSELKAIGWIKLSIDDENLVADKLAAEEMRRDQRSSYRVEKKYRKKNGTEHWGLLHVQRVPSHGEFKYAWCHWTPFHNGSQLAFARAMQYQESLDKRFIDMTAELKALTTQTDEDRWVISTMKMCQAHPKVAAFIFAVMLAVFGANNVLELFQKKDVSLHALRSDRPQNDIRYRHRRRHRQRDTRIIDNERLPLQRRQNNDKRCEAVECDGTAFIPRLCWLCHYDRLERGIA